MHLAVAPIDPILPSENAATIRRTTRLGFSPARGCLQQNGSERALQLELHLGKLASAEPVLSLT